MLYQKLRPETLDDVVGNDATVAALRAVFAQANQPHVFLFVGPTGCGKTTLARIVAKEVGCNPMADFIEINAAEARGIDTIRDVQSMVPLYPMMSKARVILFDELHMLTSQAQQCLLKTLEDVPQHQYFLLCTTDPGRLIPTIRSRCATYAMKRLRPPEMKRLLANSLARLETTLEPEVLEMIEIAAEGSPRQALVMLEQVMDLDPLAAIDSIQAATYGAKEVKELCQLLLSPSATFAKTVSLLGSIENEPEQIRRAVLGYMNAVCKSKRGNPTQAMRVLAAFCKADTFRNGVAALTLALGTLGELL